MTGRWLGFFLCGVTACSLAGCGGGPEAGEATGGGANVEIVFSLELDQQVYWDSDWGDPPQIAVWLQNKSDGEIRTAMVTHRTGRGDWEGKPQCPVSLPYWVGFYNEETGTEGPPTWKAPAADGVTRATPQKELTVRVAVPAGSEWVYFIEVNCSGDFNDRYPELSEEGVRDNYGNGQPSIVYRGELRATPGVSGQPELVGRTHQHAAGGELVGELDGITTARGLLRRVEARCAREPALAGSSRLAAEGWSRVGRVNSHSMCSRE